MIDPVANNRPSATALKQNPILCPLAAKSKVRYKTLLHHFNLVWLNLQ